MSVGRQIDGGDNYMVYTNTSGTFLVGYYDLTFFELDAQAGMTGWSPRKWNGNRKSFWVRLPFLHYTQACLSQRA